MLGTTADWLLDGLGPLSHRPRLGGGSPRGRTR